MDKKLRPKSELFRTVKRCKENIFMSVFSCCLFGLLTVIGIFNSLSESEPFGLLFCIAGPGAIFGFLKINRMSKKEFLETKEYIRKHYPVNTN